MSEDSFQTPAGWALARDAGGATMTGPEGDIRVRFVEVAAGENPQASALAAWRESEPEFASTIAREVALPLMPGWDETHQIAYATPASESRVELAFVRRLGDRAFVNLVRGSMAAVGRRGAQLNEAIKSWKPHGYRETSLADRSAAPWSAKQSTALTGFVREAMTAMQIPGVAVAVVQGGEVVFSDGFGLCRLGHDEPVTPDTPFQIGSTTKALTTLMMASLIDQGKLTWKTRVRDLLPEFALADAAMTEQLELWHTVSASTGMPRQDAEFVFRHSGLSAEDRIAQMRQMRPTTGFGETFQYSNFLVAAGGYAAARAFDPQATLTDAYDRALSKLVLEPLGMRRSFVRPSDAPSVGPPACSHGLGFAGKMEAVDARMELSTYTVAPAGAAWSTANDLAQYVRLELANGVLPGGERLLEETTLLERRKPGIKIDNQNWYGLGLIISDDSGLRVVHHGGNTFGFTSDMFFLPDKGVGGVVLTNAYAQNAFLTAIRQKIYELVFGAEAKAGQTIASVAKMQAEGVALLQQKTATDAEQLAWIEPLMGHYSCAELGRAVIEKRAEGYWIAFDEWESPLGGEIQPGGDQLLRVLGAPWRGTLKLLVNSDGTLLLDQAQHKYLFRR